MRHYATIAEQPDRTVHVRYSKIGPKTCDGDKVHIVLNSDDKQKLESTVLKWIKGGLSPNLIVDWSTIQWAELDDGNETGKQDGYYTAWFYMTKDMKDIKIRYVDKKADDELKVIDTLNDTNLKKLKTKVQRYLMKLKIDSGIQYGPKLP